jgi:hypothetical protein
MIYNLLKTGVYYYSYDPEKYNFYKKLQMIFNTNISLEEIHKDFESIDQVTFDNDTSSKYHKIYYNSVYYKDIIDIYTNFIYSTILPMFDEDIVVQKEPSFRICVPNNTALGKCITDIDSNRIGLHCDSDYNHPEEEINFMLTITGQEETNSCYIETQPMKGDFFPVKLQKGEFMSFYGNKCRHYNQLNTTGKTRISIDFRVIPYSQFKDTNASAVHSKRKFTIGEYFTIFKKTL